MRDSHIPAFISNLRHEGEKSVEKVEISPRSSSKWQEKSSFITKEVKQTEKDDLEQKTK